MAWLTAAAPKICDLEDPNEPERCIVPLQQSSNQTITLEVQVKKHVYVLCAVAMAIVLAGAAVPASAAMQSRMPDSLLRQLSLPLAKGARFTIERVPLANGKEGTLKLERFEVFSPDAVIQVTEKNGSVHRIAQPAITYYRGRVEGDEESSVLITVSDEGVKGYVSLDNRRLRIHSARAAARRANGRSESDVYIEDPQDDAAMEAPQPFKCDVENYSMTSHPVLPGGPNSFAAPTSGFTQPFTMTPNSLGTGTATYTIRLAVETDGELYVNLSNNASTVTTYISNIIAGVSTIYKRDLQTDVQLVFLNIATDPATDPWTEVAGDSFGAIDIVQARWGPSFTATPPSTISHNAVMLLSGKNAGVGLAYIDALGFADNEFGIVEHVGNFGSNNAVAVPNVPNPDIPPYTAAPNVFDFSYWAEIATAHELGHIVYSVHTHCIPFSGGDFATYGVGALTPVRSFVDTCYSSTETQRGGGACYDDGNNVALGSHAVNTNLPAEKGTIMSYCHLINLQPGGFGTATRFTFGRPNEASAKVVDLMKQRLAVITPNSPTITAPASVAQGSSGNAASVTATGAAQFFWSISNGTFGGGGTTATGTSVTFAPSGTSAVSLFVTAVSASGPNGQDPGNGASDSKSVAVTPTVCSYAITPSSRAFSSAASIGSISIQTLCAWSAGSNTPSFITLTGATSGTGNGTFTFSVTANTTGSARTGSITAGGIVFNISQSIAATSVGRTDFGADAYSDIVWRNATTGQSSIWMMNGVTVGAGSGLTSLQFSNNAFVLAGVGDFNGDGKADMVWRNNATGDSILWLMNGASVLAGSGNLTFVPSPWQIAGIGDFNRDGFSDLLWRNMSTGEDSIWLMNGTSILGGSGALPQISDMNWKVAGVGDFDKDGRSDILWRNDTTGTTAIWFMNGTTLGGASGATTLQIGSAYRVAGVGDLNGDGYADIIWRNTTTGDNILWAMNGPSIVAGSGGLLQIADLNFAVAATGDFNGDGRDDIVWRNQTTGVTTMWLMNGTAIGGGSGTFATIAAPWTVAAPR